MNLAAERQWHYAGTTVNRLKSLNTQHLAAARMKVEGMTTPKIAVQLGVAERTLHVWFSDEMMKEEIRRLLTEIDRVFVERLASAGLTALDTLSDFSQVNAAQVYYICKTCGWGGRDAKSHGDDQNLCHGPWMHVPYINEGTKLTALREILDRVDHTAKLRDKIDATKAAGDGGGAGQTNYLAIFQHMPDDQLANLLGTWASQGTNGSGPPVIDQPE